MRAHFYGRVEFDCLPEDPDTRPSMKVTVKTLDQKAFKIDIEEAFTIAQVKAAIGAGSGRHK